MSGERWPALMTPEQACEYLSISRKTLNRMKASGELMTVRVPGRNLYRYRRDDLDYWIGRLEHESAEPPASVFVEGHR